MEFNSIKARPWAHAVRCCRFKFFPDKQRSSHQQFRESLQTRLSLALAAFLFLTIIPAAAFALLGPSRSSLLVSKTVLLIDNLLALGYLLNASYRARSSARAFWLLMAGVLGIWATANIAWTLAAYSARDLQVDSIWWSFYRLYGAPVAMIFFLKDRTRASRHDPELILDWIQITILVCAAYTALLYLPIRQMLLRDALFRNEMGTDVQNVILLAAALVIYRLRRSSVLGPLFGRLVIFLFVYSIVTAIGNYLDYVHAGYSAWVDLLWSVPYLLPAALACTWKTPAEESGETSRTLPERSFGAFLASNLALMTVLIAISVLAERLTGNYRTFGISMISISLLIYAARLAITQHLQQKALRQRMEAEKELLHSATHDQLTGLPNRGMFISRLQAVIDRIRRHRQKLAAVLFIDLDDFKVINDSLGHAAGDEFIIASAQRIRRCMRSEDTVGRMGGDEFTALIEGVNDPSDAVRVAQRTQAALAEPIVLKGHTMVMSASIGIALVSAETSANSVLQQADLAMYRAKSKGRGLTELFDAAMQEQVKTRLGLEAKLRRALAQNELTIYYQPIITTATGATEGFEALCRWNLAGKFIPPDLFIPIAEQSGLIIAVGKWLLSTACDQMARWQRDYPNDPPLYVSVNVSAREFSHPNFVDQLGNVLLTTGIRPECLKLELTESVALNSAATTERAILQLHDLGVKLSIDDFGTGYSSLSYLVRFPFDTLKVDQSFVSKIDSDDGTRTIVRTILALAQSLGIAVVAEGVETISQLEYLKTARCGSVQGFLFSKPLSADAVPEFLTTNRSKRDKRKTFASASL